MKQQILRHVVSPARYLVAKAIPSDSTESLCSYGETHKKHQVTLYPVVRRKSLLDGNGNIGRFNGSLAEFDALPIDRRLCWMLQFMQQIPAARSWFNNIVGIIKTFIEYDLAEPGSWLSIVDAAILQGIQDGYTLSTGLETDPSPNPGGPIWSKFFDALIDQADEVELIGHWGSAETVATKYGEQVAARRGVFPSAYEWVFLQTGNLYRLAAASIDGGLEITEKWLNDGLEMSADEEKGLLPMNLLAPLKYGEAGLKAGYRLGTSFIDPRTLWYGRSPVYWYNKMLINMDKSRDKAFGWAF